MASYGINFVIVDSKDKEKILERGTAFTTSNSLEKAESNIAWRYVVKNNLKAKHRGAVIQFDSGRSIDGSKRGLDKMPLYLILADDLESNGISVNLDYVDHLRRKFKVTRKNYAEKYLEVINYMKGYKDQSATAQKKEEETMNNIDKTVENYVEEAEAAAVNPVPDFATTVNNFVEEEEAMKPITSMYTDVDLNDLKAIRKISNKVLSIIIDKKVNEEKHLFSVIFNILYDSGAYMDYNEEEPGKVGVFFGKSGIVLPTKSAIEFAREIWVEVGDPEWVKERDAKAIRARLNELFVPNKAKQETTASNKPETVENKAPESANKQEGNVMNEELENLLSLEATETKFDPYIKVHFNILSNGQPISQMRCITCLGMEDRKRLVERGKMKPLKLESPYFYTGTLFTEDKKKIGIWNWNTSAAGWAYPSVTIDKKTYKFTCDEEGRPTSNISMLILAMVVTLGNVRGIHAKAEPYWKRAKRKAESIDVTGQPTRTVSGPAINKKPAPAVTHAGPEDMEETLAFYGA